MSDNANSNALLNDETRRDSLVLSFLLQLKKTLVNKKIDLNS